MSEQSMLEPGRPVGKGAGRSQRRLSVKERKRLLRLYERSGVSQKQFSREQDIAVSTLSYWIRRSRRDSAVNDGAAVVEIPATVLGTPSRKSSNWERMSERVDIRLANQVELRVLAGTDTGWIVDLCKGLLTCSG